METDSELDAFREQLLTRAATKKRRFERQATEHQEALESKRHRNATPLGPKLVQDVLKLVIAFAVPDAFEIRILRRGKKQLSLMDGSEGGQVLNLDRMVSLMSLNRDCLYTIMKEIAKRMTICIKVWNTTHYIPSWENTLDSMLLKKNTQFGILAHANTVEIQDLLCWEFREDVPVFGHQIPIQGEHLDQLRTKYGADPIRDRYLRRSTATFKCQDRNAIPSYAFSDMIYHRFSLSTPLDHSNKVITSIFVRCGSDMEQWFISQPNPTFNQDDKVIADSIWDIVKGTITVTEPIGLRYSAESKYRVGKAKPQRAELRNEEDQEPTRYFTQLRNDLTRPAYEEIKDFGWWEEDEMRVQTGAWRRQDGSRSMRRGALNGS